MAAITLILILKYTKPKWATDSGSEVKIVRLKGKPLYFLAGSLLLVIAGGLYSFFNSPSVAENKAIRVFTSGSDKFNIMILPFDQECVLCDDTLYDVSKEIRKRLTNINGVDSVNLDIYYLTTPIDYSNFTQEDAEKLMKYHHADMILYGAYSYKQCEGGTSDKVCYNYLTDFKKWNIIGVHEQTEYKMLDHNGLDDIRKGAGQEDIDYIIYCVAAMSEIKKKNFTGAIRKFQKVNGFENNERIMFQISECYYYIHDYARGRQFVEKVLQINPDNEEAMIHLGIFSAYEGKREFAKQCFEKVLKTNPDNQEALRNIALYYKTIRDTVTAKTYFTRLLQLIPDSNAIVLGTIYSDMGDFRKSITYFEKHLNVHFYHADHWNTVGLMKLSLGDTTNGAIDFIKAIKIDSTYSKAWYNLGKVCLNAKKYELARQDFTKVVELEPSNVEAWGYLGVVYLWLKEDRKALKSFEKALFINPGYESVISAMPELYGRLKMYDREKDYLEKLAKKHPDSIMIWNKLGIAYANLDNYKEATKWFKKMQQRLPNEGVVYYNLASMSSYQGDQTAALNHLSRALVLTPSLRETVQKDKAFNWLYQKKEFLAIVNDN
jgi:tetratricopeptide (TPR) repeat protein